MTQLPYNLEHLLYRYLTPKQQKQYKLPPPPKPIKTPPIVIILWEDPIAIAMEWETPEQTLQHTPEPTITIGYLYQKTDTHHIIINTNNLQHIGGGMLIPNNNIIKTITLPHPTQ